MLSFFYWLNFAINYLWMCDYRLKMQYVLNSKSYNNRQTVKSTRRYFIPLSLFEFLSLTFPLNFQLINFPLHERILLYFSCPRPYNVSNGPRPSFIPNSYNTSPMLSFVALVKTFSECWSTLIVMIYDTFASQTEHFFAMYSRTKQHFMSLLRAFW